MRPRQAPRRAGRLSLRGRVLAIAMLLVVAALLGSNAVNATLLQRNLTQQFDARLGRAAASSAQALTADPLRQQTPSPGDAMRAQLTGDVYLASVSGDGQRQRVLQAAAGSPPRLPRLDAATVAARGGRPFESKSRDGGHSWRVLIVTLPRGESTQRRPADPEDDVSLIVAGSLAQVDGTVRDLGMRMLLIDVLVLVLLGALGWFAVRRGLRPLRVIESTAAAIADGDLSGRVPDLAPPGTELGRLSAALNTMLDRIQEGDAARAATADRMRRFLADASHELRTPLFGVKGFTELYRMGGMPERADVDVAMARIEREAGRLVRLVEDLLLLARLEESEAGSELPLRLTPMDLRTLAVDALHDIGALAPERPVSLTGPGGGPPSEAPVLGDEARLRQVISNLVGNAVAHTPPGTPIRIGVGATADLAVLELSDSGPGMSPEQAARAFDRFFRADDARGREGGGGAGLGLSIVHSLVTAHHGRIDLHTAPGQGATFRVLLPLHRESARARE